MGTLDIFIKICVPKTFSWTLLSSRADLLNFYWGGGGEWRICMDAKYFFTEYIALYLEGGAAGIQIKIIVYNDKRNILRGMEKNNNYVGLGLGDKNYL